MYLLICFFVIVFAKTKNVILRYRGENRLGLLHFYDDDRTLFTLYINTYLPFTLIRPYKNSLSALMSSYIDKKYIEELNRRQIIEDFNIQNYIINDYSYYSFNDKYTVDQLSLSYSFENESLSLVHMLYNNKVIEHKLFVIAPKFDKEKNGYLYIGSIPNNTEHIKNKGKCKVQDDSLWSCQLDNIIVNRTILNMNSKVIFHTGFEYTLLSKKLYDFLVNKIFVNYIKKDICRVVPTPFEALFCPNIDKINIDFDIQFTFNDMIIKIPFRQFMIKNKNIIPVYPIGRFQGDIVIGTPFISQFNYTVFDYDDKSISLYSDWIHIENRKTISQAALMCCFIVFNCMAIAIVFNLKNKVNNLY